MKEYNESIFTAICSYIPHPGINPIENFLTELLAWTINNIEGFGVAYVKHLNEVGQLKLDCSQMKNIEALTQVHISTGFIDMVIKTDTVSFICEHKVNSELSEGQIKKYMDNKSELTLGGCYSVLLTKSQTQWTQKADIKILWSKIEEWIRKELESDYYEVKERFILDNFSAFLREGGLGMTEAINREELKHYLYAKKIEDILYSVFSELAREDWSNYCPKLKDFPESRNDFKPTFNKMKWGRIGLSFFEEWNPGLFAGVILDGTDHCLDLDETKGPEFVVLIDIQYNDKTIFKQAIESDWLKAIIDRLKQNHSPFNGFISYPDLKNKYRLVVLRKPLFDVISEIDNFQDQIQSIRGAIIGGINLLLGENK